MKHAELWKPIPGHGGIYEASSSGRIRNAVTGHIKSQSIQKGGGRYQVGLTYDGRSIPHRVHKLVALAFHGECPDGLEIRHLNGDQTDNRVSNLRYGTHSENEQDRVRHGTHHHARKTHCQHGHPFSAENTYINPWSGQRVCRECARKFKRDYANRKRTAVLAEASK